MADDWYHLESEYLNLFQLILDDQRKVLGYEPAMTISEAVPIRVDTNGNITEYYGDLKQILRQMICEYEDAVGEHMARRRVRSLVRTSLSSEARSLLPADIPGSAREEVEDNGDRYVNCYLTLKDWEVPAAGILAAFFATIIAHWQDVAWTQQTLYVDILPLAVLVATVHFGVNLVDHWDGLIQQPLRPIVFSIGLYGIILHTLFLPYQNIGSPPLLDMTPGFWTGALTLILAGTFLLGMYGLYQLRQIGAASLHSRDTGTSILTSGVGMAGLLFGLGAVGGVLGQSINWGLQGWFYPFWGGMVPGLFCLGFYYVYWARNHWGGDIARYMDMIGIGLILHILLSVPLIDWHIARADVVVGLGHGTIYILLSALSAAAFITSLYGFRLFLHHRR